MTSALAATTESEQFRSPFLRPDYRQHLGNYSPYARSYQFPVYYPSFQHAEEEESVEEVPIRLPYKHTSVNVFTSSDSENNYSSESNDYSGPSFSSRSGDSASSSGSDSGKYTLAGDSASDYIDSVSSSSDHGHSFPGDSSFESEDSDYSSTSGAQSGSGGPKHGSGSFDFDLDAILGAAGYGYAAGPRLADAHLPPQQYVDLDARCARVDFGWNFLGIGGTLDFYQPAHGELLADVDFDNLQRDSRYGLAIHTLGATAGERCDANTMGPMLSGGHLGTFVTDRKGRGGLRTFKDLDLDDLIGMSVALQGRYEDFAFRPSYARTYRPHLIAAQVAATTEAGEPLYADCTCGGQVAYYQEGGAGNGGTKVPCPNGDAVCTQAQCEAEYTGLCPYCTDANIGADAD